MHVEKPVQQRAAVGVVRKLSVAEETAGSAASITRENVDATEKQDESKFNYLTLGGSLMSRVRPNPLAAVAFCEDLHELLQISIRMSFCA